MLLCLTAVLRKAQTDILEAMFENKKGLLIKLEKKNENTCCSRLH